MATPSLKNQLRQLLAPKTFLLLIFLFALYFLTRLINLDTIPVFADEAIYIRWAQIMKNEPTLRFLPLSDGKQPLFMWLIIPFLKFVSDPVIAGRLTSVAAGFGTLVGLLALVWYITRSRFSAVLVALLYILTPYTLFFDRMALADSLLAMFSVWSAFFGILLINHPRLDLSLLLGFVLGGAFITKSPGLFFILLQPTLLLIITTRRKTHFLKILSGWFIAFLLGFAIYNILRLGPNFHLISSRNLDYIFPVSEAITHPLNPLTGNLKATFSWFTLLLTWPVFILLLIAPFANAKKSPYIFALIFWSLLPLLAQAFVAKVYTPRYLLYIIPLLLVVATISLSDLSKRLKPRLFSILLVLVFAFLGFSSFTLLTKPTQAKLPERMRSGYFREWTAGYGLKEIAAYLEQRSQSATLVVGTEGYFGTLPDGLQIYTEGKPNITVIGVGQPVTKLPESLLNSLEEHEVYLLVNNTRNLLTPIELTKLEPIATYPRLPPLSGEAEYLEFFRLHPQPVR